MTAPIFVLLEASDEVKSFLKKGNESLRAYEFGLAKDKPTTPYLVWQDISGDPQNNLDCPAKTDHITIQIDIYTTNPHQGQTKHCKNRTDYLSNKSVIVNKYLRLMLLISRIGFGMKKSSKIW